MKRKSFFMKLKNYLPVLDWLPKYNKKQFKGDLAAGLTVGVMLIPQGMAYAMIAGLPPIYGLYASTIPLIIYALLGTSRQLAVGPVAMVSLLTAAGIGVLAEGGTETYILLAITLAFMVGLIQFLLGAFRLGFLVNFLSHPVISGFTSAAALIIGLSQLKHLLGVDIPRSHHVHEILIHAFERIGAVNSWSLAIGMGSIAMIIFVRKINKAIPGALLVVVLGILLVWFFGLHSGGVAGSSNGVKIVGTIPGGLPGFSLPDFSLTTLQNLLPIALAIALVSFMESIAVAKAIQAKHNSPQYPEENYKVDANQELVALGLSNIGGSFLQSYPVTGGFSRTAVNDQAGAKTGMASLITAALIVLTLLFLTPLFYYLPNAVLAAIIMVAVFGLIDYKEAIHLWLANRTDFWMLVVTFIATLALGIEQGIGIGVLLSLMLMIYRSSRPHIAVLGNIQGTHFYRNKARFEEVECTDDMLIVRVDAQLYFANINYFLDQLEQEVIAKGVHLKVIIINAESISYLDSSAMHGLADMVENYQAQGLTVYFSGVIGPVRDAMKKGHLLEKVGGQNFFLSVQNAVDCHRLKSKDQDYRERKDYTLQTSVRPN